MEKEVDINGKKVIVKEISYMQGVSLEECPTKSEKIRKLMMFSTGLTDEEMDKLSMKEGVKLQKVVNEINGLSDFRKPVVKEKEN